MRILLTLAVACMIGACAGRDPESAPVAVRYAHHARKKRARVVVVDERDFEARLHEWEADVLQSKRPLPEAICATLALEPSERSAEQVRGLADYDRAHAGR